MQSSWGDGQPGWTLRETALVVLAAGRSTRMGSPKALAQVDGRSLLEHVLAPPMLPQFGDVVVVLGHHADALRPVAAARGVRHVENPDPDGGRTGSVQLGLRALSATIRAVFVQPVDCPIIRPETYTALASALGSADVVVPSYRGKRGHPPLISARIRSRILALAPDMPLRKLWQAAGVDCRFLEIDDPGVAVNINRPEDLQILSSLLSFRRGEDVPRVHGEDAPGASGPSTT